MPAAASMLLPIAKAGVPLITVPSTPIWPPWALLNSNNFGKCSAAGPLLVVENGADYADALKDAQAKGYAEANPAGDVDGHDAAAKVVILANLMMDQKMAMGDVSCIGISGITRTEIESAQTKNQRWKLIGTIENVNGQVQGSVKPVKLDSTHPLYGVGGATNAITYSTDLLGDVTLIGPGAGRIETGYAIIGDILSFSH